MRIKKLYNPFFYPPAPSERTYCWGPSRARTSPPPSAWPWRRLWRHTPPELGSSVPSTPVALHSLHRCEAYWMPCPLHDFLKFLTNSPRKTFPQNFPNFLEYIMLFIFLVIIIHSSTPIKTEPMTEHAILFFELPRNSCWLSPSEKKHQNYLVWELRTTVYTPKQPCAIRRGSFVFGLLDSIFWNS